MSAPTEPRRLDRALALLDEDRPDLAERELLALLAEDPENAEGHALLAYALIGQRREGEALDAAREAARQEPDHPWVLQALGEALLGVGDWQEAEPAARAALQAIPDEPAVHGMLASALIQKADASRFARSTLREALRVAERGLALRPTDYRCLILRAQALSRLGRGEEARAAAEAAVRQRPDQATAHAVRGTVEIASGRARVGYESLGRALRLDPNDPFVRARLGLSDERRRSFAALVVQAERWRWPLRLLLGAMWAATGVGLLRGWGWRDPFVAATGAYFATLWHIAIWFLRRRYHYLLEPLRVRGALGRAERLWANATLVLWIAFGLGAALFSVYG